MDPLTIGALIGAGGGLLKYVNDSQNEKQDRTLAAKTALYSPWTGLTPQPVKRASLLGDMLGTTATGASMGAAFQNANTWNDLLKARMAQSAASPNAN